MSQTKISRILAVDDVQDNLALIEGIFEDGPYEVVTARDAETAMELARRQRPDIVILDVQMPVTDGFELCKLLRAEFTSPPLPILFLTAERTTTDSTVRGLSIGACDYVTKPCEPDILRARVQAVLRTHAEREDHLETAQRVTRRLLQD
jgi:DNA-binding response OmpR family regulator